VFCIVLDILKKNFSKLCKCLPKDYTKTADKMRQMGIPSLDHLKYASSLEEANGSIVCIMIIMIRTEVDVLPFCETMKALVQSKKSKEFIDNIMKGRPDACTAYISKTMYMYS